MTSNEHGIGQIRRLARRAEQRIRLARAVRVGAKALCVALVLCIADVALRKVGLLSERLARGVLAAALAGVPAAAVVGWAWRLPERAGARVLDRFHSLHDRLATALAFAEHPRPTAFMEAAIEDAVALAPGARPAQAVPIVLPRALAAAGGLAGALVMLMLFEVRTHTPIARASTLEGVEMAPDDLEDVKDFLKQIEQRQPNDDTRSQIEEFNRLVDDIASRRLDRTEAFRRMESLEEKLVTRTPADKKALEEQLESIGRELKKAELTRPTGEALADGKLDEARDALRELSKKLAQTHSTAADKARLDQMREALKKASEQAEKRQRDLEQRRQELADEILKKKQQMGDAGSDEERSLLEKKQRELERLDRDFDAQKNQGRQLDRLDRELAQAAQDLMNDLGMSAQDLERGAEDMNHMQEEQATEQQKEELRQKIEEMRQLVRQQGAGGKGQVVRLKRFGRMARGQGGGSGGSNPGGGSGAEGQDGQGQGEQGQQGQQGQGGQGGQQPGSGQQQQPGGSQGSGGGAGQQGETWIVGANGQKMLMLSKGGGGSGSGNGGSDGTGPGHPGTWGEGHDPNVQGKGTNPSMGTQDTQVQGSDTGQGGSRSQVILGAAERGFASRAYKKVYTEYHQVAEESFAKDEIPGGYRFYVKRYFQLIRPRDER